MADIEMTSDACSERQAEEETTVRQQHHQHQHQAPAKAKATSCEDTRLFSTVHTTVSSSNESSSELQQQKQKQKTREERESSSSSSSYRRNHLAGSHTSLAISPTATAPLPPSSSSGCWVVRTYTQLYKILKRVVIIFLRSNLILWDCCHECIEADDSINQICINSVVMEMLRAHLLEGLATRPLSPNASATSNGETDATKTLSPTSGIANDELVLVYNLELNAFNKTKLYRCEKYNRVLFRLAPSLYGRKVQLMSNYQEEYTKFDRKRYKEIKIDDVNNTLKLSASGSFHFIYQEAQQPHNILGSFYIVVNPELSARRPGSKKSQPLSINAIQCQTVLSKCMGSIDTWKDKLMVSLIFPFYHLAKYLELGECQHLLQHDSLDTHPRAWCIAFRVFLGRPTSNQSRLSFEIDEA